MLKIRNEELKKKCPTLMGYMQYVEKVRNYTGTMPLREAVERSIEECIKEDILVSFFQRNRAEAIHVSITQYNQEAHMARIAETNRKKGREAGRECINQLNEKLLADERIEDLQRSVTDSGFQMQLLNEYGLWEDETDC